MGRIRDLVKRNRTFFSSTEAGPSFSSNVAETAANPPEQSLCSACSKISTYHNVEHWSFGALMSSSLNGCPCCRLIYWRLKELAPAGPLRQEDPDDPSQLNINNPSRRSWDRVSVHSTHSAHKFNLGNWCRSRILLDGLSSGMVFKVTDWPDVGEHNGSFEFFRRRGTLYSGA